MDRFKTLRFSPSMKIRRSRKLCSMGAEALRGLVYWNFDAVHREAVAAQGALAPVPINGVKLLC